MLWTHEITVVPYRPKTPHHLNPSEKKKPSRHLCRRLETIWLGMARQGNPGQVNPFVRPSTGAKYPGRGPKAGTGHVYGTRISRMQLARSGKDSGCGCGNGGRKVKKGSARMRGETVVVDPENRMR